MFPLIQAYKLFHYRVVARSAYFFSLRFAVLLASSPLLTLGTVYGRRYLMDNKSLNLCNSIEHL